MALLPVGFSKAMGHNSPVKTNQPNLEAEAVFYALQTDLGLSLSDLATMTLIQAIGWQ